MTAYFDRKQTELRDLAEERFEEFERGILQDVANVGELLRAKDEKGRLEFGAFPEDLRDAAYQVLLCFSPAAWPPVLKYAGPVYEDTAAHRRGLRDMLDALHDLLHAAAHRGWEGGDSIQHPIREAHARMEERCKELALAAGAKHQSWAIEAEKQLEEPVQHLKDSDATKDGVEKPVSILDQ